MKITEEDVENWLTACTFAYSYFADVLNGDYTIEQAREDCLSIARGAEFERASGLVICEQCGKYYYDHPQHHVFRFLNVTCDGRLWKL